MSHLTVFFWGGACFIVLKKPYKNRQIAKATVYPSLLCVLNVICVVSMRL